MPGNSGQFRDEDYLMKFRVEYEELLNIGYSEGEQALRRWESKFLDAMRKYDRDLWKSIMDAAGDRSGRPNEDVRADAGKMARELFENTERTQQKMVYEERQPVLYLEIREEIAELYKRESDKDGERYRLRSSSELYKAWRRRNPTAKKEPTLFWTGGETRIDIKDSVFCSYAEIGKSTIGDIKQGEKAPHKDTLLKICIALSWDSEKTQKYLCMAGCTFNPDKKKENENPGRDIAIPVVKEKVERDHNRDIAIASFMKNWNTQWHKDHKIYYHVSDMKKYLHAVNGYNQRRFDPLYPEWEEIQE